MTLSGAHLRTAHEIDGELVGVSGRIPDPRNFSIGTSRSFRTSLPGLAQATLALRLGLLFESYAVCDLDLPVLDFDESLGAKASEIP
jgi:hypothetical protein